MFVFIYSPGGPLKVCTSDGGPFASSFVHPLLAYAEGACQWTSELSLLLQSAQDKWNSSWYVTF